MGGLVTFDLRGGLDAGVRFVEALKIAQLATSASAAPRRW